MSDYILVSLWAEDDAATVRSHAFACRLHNHRPATEFLEGAAVSLDDLQRCAAMAADATVIVFSHGGSYLSARRAGPVWSNAQQFGKLLSGRRVYAFACDTFTPSARLLWGHFAEQAVTACISVFAGHAAPVMSPSIEQGAASAEIEAALFELIERFVDGEQDQDTLRSIGESRVSWDLPVELDLPSDDPDQEGAFGWSSALFLGQFFKSLCIRTKAGGAEH